MTSELFTIRRRVCYHFTGFEPLSANVHRLRYVRSARKSAETYGFNLKFGAADDDAPVPNFNVVASADGWQTETRVFLADHKSVIDLLDSHSFATRLSGALRAAFDCIWQGALYRFVKTAPRFALLSVFPYLFLIFSVLAIAAIAAWPLIGGLSWQHFAWSIPASFAFYRFVLLPISAKLHVKLLLDANRFVNLATNPELPEIRAEVARHVTGLETALKEEADEFLITTHSMGCVFGIFAVAALLERNPGCFAGRNAAFMTIAGNGMFVSLHGSARELRHSIRKILECPDIQWLDVQCRSDPVQLHGGHVVRGHIPLDPSFAGVREPHVRSAKPNRMVTKQQYKSMKWDLLHKHRQFVLGSHLPSDFDFFILTAGPHRAFYMRNLRPRQKLSVVMS